MKTIADTLDYISVSNDMKQRIQEITQRSLNTLKEVFMSDKGWPEKENNLDIVNDRNFIWMPKFTNDFQNEEEGSMKEEESEDEKSISLFSEGKYMI